MIWRKSNLLQHYLKAWIDSMGDESIPHLCHFLMSIGDKVRYTMGIRRILDLCIDEALGFPQMPSLQSMFNEDAHDDGASYASEMKNRRSSRE